MPVYEEPADGLTVAAEALADWTVRLVEAAGTPPEIATDVGEVLVAADRRGIASHGTARLPNYLALIEAGVMDPAATPVLEGGRAAFARFDARNGWGHHAGRVAVDHAIEVARVSGIGMTVVRNSNHYGIAAWYALRAARQGLIGMSFTNSSPLVAATRARLPLIGTNPIAIAAPAGRWGAFCLDMATSTIPRGRIEVALRRGEPIPAGWAIDAEGRPALTPEAALAGALQPLGGAEATGGYKGYGLALAVDLLTGVLAGASFGPNIVGLFSTEAPSDLGHAFIVIDPTAADPAVPGDADGEVAGEPAGARRPASPFEARLERYLDQLTSAPTIPDAPGRVLVPGEPEAEAERRSIARGVVLDRQHALGLVALGERFGVPFPVGLVASP